MKFCRFNVLTLALVCASGITFSQSLDPDAPTHEVKSASKIDREWQISVAQFSAKRSRILYDVDRQGEAGPYYPDWETLHIDIPQWYKDGSLTIGPTSALSSPMTAWPGRRKSSRNTTPK